MEDKNHKGNFDKKSEEIVKLIFENLELSSKNVKLAYENEILKKKVRLMEERHVKTIRCIIALEDKGNVVIKIGKEGSGYLN